MLTPNQLEALERIGSLKAAGVLSDEEFAELKTKILQGEQKTTFDVVLLDGKRNKIFVVKAVRELTGLDLKSAVGLVDRAPSIILRSIPRDDAERAAKRLSSDGGIVEIR